MNERMRLLFGYDGSSYADAALDDLRRAGLPDEVEALVVTVVEGVLPSDVESEFTGGSMTSRTLSTGRLILAQAQANADEAEANLTRAAERLRAGFPRWQVASEVLRGAPAEAIIRRAEEYGADLIMVGSQGRSALGRLFLGSVSKKVVTESRSSVRVARRTVEKGQDAPPRIMIGVDGSPGAERAVRSVGRRAWPEGTEVRIVAVDDGVSPARFAHILPTAAEIIRSSNEEAAGKAGQIVEWAAEELRAVGLSVSVVIEKGEPQRILIEEAQKWDADSIFVGTRGLDHPDEKSGLGGISTGLVTNAICTVEVVR